VSTKKRPLTPAERQDRQIAHDFANEGDCLVCGDLQVLIERGEVRPCFEWERVVEDDGGESQPSSKNGAWDGC